MNLPKILLTTLFLTLASTFAYAEHTAPVYDVDSMSNDGTQPANAAPINTASSAPAVTTSVIPVTSPTPSAPPLSTEQRLALATAEQKEMANRLVSMQEEVQALRGQVEELSHRLQEVTAQANHAETSKQQLNQAAVEPTMSHLPREVDDEGGAVAPKPTHAKSGSPAPAMAENKAEKIAAKKAAAPRKNVEQPNAAEEQAVYQTAFNLIKAKKYNEAIATLQKMLSKYPSGQFAANAHYWLGELYSLTGQHAQAANEFATVVKHYPGNPRVADSELKLGLIYATELKWAEAKSAFSKVLHKYPGTPSARLAMEQLKQLKQAGH